MLSAIRTEDRSQVILLREDGLPRAEHLRQEARAGRIVCEVCDQSVVVRAGEERIWHFAHRSRIDCPKAKDSLEIVECRALLYRWLRVRFPDTVQLEKVLPGLPRPVDCWVDRPGKPPLAWWLVPSAVKPDLREGMAVGCQGLSARLHAVFPARLLVLDPDHPKHISLSATLRELTEESAYFELYGGRKSSLHFLDPERQRLVSCRGLLETHPPQGYLANLLDHPLGEVRLHPRTGEFVHPGEFEALKVLQEKAARERRMEQEREQRRRAQEAERKREYQKRLEREAAQTKVEPIPLSAGLHLVAEPTAHPLHEPSVLPDPSIETLLTCKVCGARTRDWVVRYGTTGLCKCRSCTR